MQYCHMDGAPSIMRGAHFTRAARFHLEAITTDCHIFIVFSSNEFSKQAGERSLSSTDFAYQGDKKTQSETNISGGRQTWLTILGVLPTSTLLVVYEKLYIVRYQSVIQIIQ